MPAGLTIARKKETRKKLNIDAFMRKRPTLGGLAKNVCEVFIWQRTALLS